MKLKHLSITLQPSYADNAGKYEGEFEWEERGRGTVKIVLDPAISERLLAFIGPVITEFGHAACLDLERQIQQSLSEARQAPAIEAA
jgi:hypothetical protein